MSSISPSLNRLIQNTICSFDSGVFSIFSRAMAISRSTFLVSKSPRRVFTESLAKPSSIAVRRFSIFLLISDSCFCRKGIVVFSCFCRATIASASLSIISSQSTYLAVYATTSRSIHAFLTVFLSQDFLYMAFPHL